MHQNQQTWILNPRDRAKVYRRKAFECRKLAYTAGLCDAERAGYLLVADAYERALDNTASFEPNGVWWASILRAGRARYLRVANRVAALS